MIIGITGSRLGGSEEQLERLRALLAPLPARFEGKELLLVHGDCVGVDAEADAIARELGIITNCFPGNFPGWRAHTGAPELAGPAHPWVRNQKIVDICHWLIALPHPESKGTWMTWSMGAKAKRVRTHIRRDGTQWRSWVEGGEPRQEAS